MAAAGRGPKNGTPGDSNVEVVGGQITVSTDPSVGTGVLRALGSGILLLGKATVYYRFLIGRQLMVIQNTKLWREMERRDYRADTDGAPLWKGTDDRFYSSWYQFLEHGFQCVTGLQREAAYSTLKLARSTAFAALPTVEIKKIARLANALRIVAAERQQLAITPDLVRQAQEMTTTQFREITANVESSNRSKVDISCTRKIMRFLKAAALANPDVVNDFWTTIERIMATTNRDPAITLRTVVLTCSGTGRTASCR